MPFQISNGVTDCFPQISEELSELIPVEMERTYGNRPMSSGALVPIVDPSYLGDVSDSGLAKILTLVKVNSVGQFRIVASGNTGTEVLSTQVDTMQVIMQEAQGAVRIPGRRVRHSIQNGSSIMSSNNAKTITDAWRRHLDSVGYAGNLAFGLQGLFTVPFPTFTFSGPWSGLTGQQLENELQGSLSQHKRKYPESSISLLALPTIAYGQIKSLKLAGTGISVRESLLNNNPELSIVEVRQFDGVGPNGSDIAMWLPYDSDQLAYAISPEPEYVVYAEGDSQVVQGSIITAGLIAASPTCGLRLVGL
jgi:hypothetical protein